MDMVDKEAVRRADEAEHEEEEEDLDFTGVCIEKHLESAKKV